MTPANAARIPLAKNSYDSLWQTGTWGSRERLIVKIESEENIHIKVIKRNLFMRVAAFVASFFVSQEKVDTICTEVICDKDFKHLNKDLVEEEKEKLAKLLESNHNVQELVKTIEIDLSSPPSSPRQMTFLNPFESNNDEEKSLSLESPLLDSRQAAVNAEAAVVEAEQMAIKIENSRFGKKWADYLSEWNKEAKKRIDQSEQINEIGPSFKKLKNKALEDFQEHFANVIDTALLRLSENMHLTPKLAVDIQKQRALNQVRLAVLEQRKQTWEDCRREMEFNGKDLNALVDFEERLRLQQEGDDDLLQMLSHPNEETLFGYNTPAHVLAYGKNLLRTFWGGHEKTIDGDLDDFDSAVAEYLETIFAEMAVLEKTLPDDVSLSDHISTKTLSFEEMERLVESFKKTEQTIKGSPELTEDQKQFLKSSEKFQRLTFFIEALLNVQAKNHRNYLEELERLRNGIDNASSHHSIEQLAANKMAEIQNKERFDPQANIFDYHQYHQWRIEVKNVRQYLEQLHKIAAVQEKYFKKAEDLKANIPSLTGEEAKATGNIFDNLIKTIEVSSEEIELDTPGDLYNPVKIIPITHPSYLSAYEEKIEQNLNQLLGLFNTEKTKQIKRDLIIKKIDAMGADFQGMEASLTALEQVFSRDYKQPIRFEKLHQELKRRKEELNVWKSEGLLPRSLYYLRFYEKQAKIEDLTVAELKEYEDELNYQIYKQRKFLREETFIAQTDAAYAAFKAQEGKVDRQVQMLGKLDQITNSPGKQFKYADELKKCFSAHVKGIGECLDYYVKNLDQAQELFSLSDIASLIKNKTIRSQYEIDDYRKKQQLHLMDQIDHFTDQPEIKDQIKQLFLESTFDEIKKHKEKLDDYIEEFSMHGALHGEAKKIAQDHKKLLDQYEAKFPVKRMAFSHVPLIGAPLQEKIDLSHLAPHELKQYEEKIQALIKRGEEVLGSFREAKNKRDQATQKFNDKIGEMKRTVSELQGNEQLVYAKAFQKKIDHFNEQFKELANETINTTFYQSVKNFLFGTKKFIQSPLAGTAKALISVFSDPIQSLQYANHLNQTVTTWCRQMDEERRKVKSNQKLSIASQIDIASRANDPQLEKELRSLYAKKIHALTDPYISTEDTVEVALKGQSGSPGKLPRGKFPRLGFHVSHTLGQYISQNSRFYDQLHGEINERIARITNLKTFYRTDWKLVSNLIHKVDFFGVIGAAYKYFNPYNVFTDIENLSPYHITEHEKELKKTIENIQSDFLKKFPIDKALDQEVEYLKAIKKAEEEVSSLRKSGDRYAAYEVQLLIEQAEKNKEKWKGKIHSVSALTEFAKDVKVQIKKLNEAIAHTKALFEDLTAREQLEKFHAAIPSVDRFKSVKRFLIDIQGLSPEKEAYLSKINSDIDALRDEIIEKVKTELKNYRKNLEDLKEQITELYLDFKVDFDPNILSRIDQELKKADDYAYELPVTSEISLVFGKKEYKNLKNIEQFTVDELVGKDNPLDFVEKMVKTGRESLAPETDYRSQIITRYQKFKEAIKEANETEEKLRSDKQIFYANGLKKKIVEIESYVDHWKSERPIEWPLSFKPQVRSREGNAQFSDILYERTLELKEETKKIKNAPKLDIKDQIPLLTGEEKHEIISDYQNSVIEKHTKAESIVENYKKKIEAIEKTFGISGNFIKNLKNEFKTPLEEIKGIKFNITKKSSIHELETEDEKIKSVLNAANELQQKYKLKQLSDLQESYSKVIRDAQSKYESYMKKGHPDKAKELEIVLSNAENTIKDAVRTINGIDPHFIYTNPIEFENILNTTLTAIRDHKISLENNIDRIEKSTPKTGAELLNTLDERSAEYAMARTSLLARLAKKIEEYKTQVEKYEEYLTNIISKLDKISPSTHLGSNFRHLIESEIAQTIEKVEKLEPRSRSREDTIAYEQEVEKITNPKLATTFENPDYGLTLLEKTPHLKRLSKSIDEFTNACSNIDNVAKNADIKHAAKAEKFKDLSIFHKEYIASEIADIKTGDDVIDCIEEILEATEKLRSNYERVYKDKTAEAYFEGYAALKNYLKQALNINKDTPLDQYPADYINKRQNFIQTIIHKNIDAIVSNFNQNSNMLQNILAPPPLSDTDRVWIQYMNDLRNYEAKLGGMSLSLDPPRPPDQPPFNQIWNVFLTKREKYKNTLRAKKEFADLSEDNQFKATKEWNKQNDQKKSELFSAWQDMSVEDQNEKLTNWKTYHFVSKVAACLCPELQVEPLQPAYGPLILDDSQREKITGLRTDLANAIGQKIPEVSGYANHVIAMYNSQVIQSAKTPQQLQERIRIIRKTVKQLEADLYKKWQNIGIEDKTRKFQTTTSQSWAWNLNFIGED